MNWELELQSRMKDAVFVVEGGPEEVGIVVEFVLMAVAEAVVVVLINWEVKHQNKMDVGFAVEERHVAGVVFEPVARNVYCLKLGDLH